MIPKNITKKHILKALNEIERDGIPPRRDSVKFSLFVNDKHYPPKYIISLANKYANGELLSSKEFSGGNESNNFLRKLGFQIADAGIKKRIPKKKMIKKIRIPPSGKSHNERCPRCKDTVVEILQNLYGEVVVNPKFNIGSRPDDFKDKPFYKDLLRIYTALQKHRKYKEFVRSITLPNCDFFVPNPGFLVEFDETQHFTIPRQIALQNYRETTKLGFDKEKWEKLCALVNAKDRDPPFRDEQRAWYDTLRDFLPLIVDLKPTIRLFSKDFRWCDFNSDDPWDLQRFKRLIDRFHLDSRIEIYKNPDPLIARIIIAKDWPGDPSEAREVLSNVIKEWPENTKVKFLGTCGGFIQFKWPKNISRREIIDNKNASNENLSILIKEAEKCIRDSVLTSDLTNQLKKFTDYITVGIDSFKSRISISQIQIGKLHVELVALIDLNENRIHWTGKSYPTTGQERGLVRNLDYDNHFLELDNNRVLILGCHDLNIFNNRNWKKTGEWRRRIKEEIRDMSKKLEPTIVLHHPHTCVKVKTWKNSWNLLKELLPSVEYYIGTGRYYEPKRDIMNYDDLKSVLLSTKLGSSLDFIIR